MKTGATNCPCPSQSRHGEEVTRSRTQFSRKSRPKTVLLAGWLLVGASFAAHAAFSVMTGFESPTYTGSPGGDALAGQDGWAGSNFTVHTYSGSQIPHGPAAGGQYSAPVNLTGGSQFAGQGTGFGSNTIAGTFSGLVEMSGDYAPGFQFDNNGNYNGAILARAGGGLRVTGFYTGDGTGATDPDPSGGPWAPQFFVWDAAGNQQITAGGPLGYIFGGQAGFDDLNMESWYRMGVVFDTTTRRITQLKSQDLSVGGAIWTMDNPTGPLGEDLYIEGGSAGSSVPIEVRLYNVGNGTVSMYDNLYVGDPYSWQPVVPEPSTAGMLFAGLAGLLFARRRK